jgi:hypothetical protein
MALLQSLWGGFLSAFHLFFSALSGDWFEMNLCSANANILNMKNYSADRLGRRSPLAISIG